MGDSNGGDSESCETSLFLSKAVRIQLMECTRTMLEVKNLSRKKNTLR